MWRIGSRAPSTTASRNWLHACRRRARTRRPTPPRPDGATSCTLARSGISRKPGFCAEEGSAVEFGGLPWPYFLRTLAGELGFAAANIERGCKDDEGADPRPQIDAFPERQIRHADGEGQLGKFECHAERSIRGGIAAHHTDVSKHRAQSHPHQGRYLVQCRPGPEEEGGK